MKIGEDVILVKYKEMNHMSMVDEEIVFLLLGTPMEVC